MRRWFPYAAGLLGAIVLGVGVLWCAAWFSRAKLGHDRRFDSEILQAAELYSVDPSLIKAVIWKESTFNAAARGKAGEIGLMQLLEPAAIEWSSANGVTGFAMEHLTDPTTNIMAGTWYLSRLLQRYQHTDDAVPYALADYNAGRGNVLKWIKAAGAATNSAVFVQQIGFESTRRYVEAVMARRKRYQS